MYLLISGEGRLKKELMEFVLKQGLKDRVKFYDYDAESFLDLVNILIIASSKEGFGFTVLEAFAKEVCVVASRTGGLQEIIKDKECGIFFDPYNAPSLANTLDNLIKDNSFKRRLVNKGRERLNEFSLDRMIRYTEKVYKEALSL